MRVFVIGGTGIVGTSVVPALRANGHHVVGLAPTDADAAKLKAAGAEVLTGDAADAELVARAAREADGVIHLLKLRPFQEWARIDAIATGAMLDAMRGSGKPFVYGSGANSYGDTGKAKVDESYQSNNPADYGSWRTQDGSQARVLAAAKDNVRVSVIKPAVIIGNNNGQTSAQVVWRREGVVYYFGEGDSVTAWVHVDDLADLYVLALEKAPAGTVLNAAADEPVNRRELALAVGKALGWTVRSIPVEEARANIYASANQINNISLSNARARALGWNPKWQSILETAPDWVKTWEDVRQTASR